MVARRAAPRASSIEIAARSRARARASLADAPRETDGGAVTARRAPRAIARCRRAWRRHDVVARGDVTRVTRRLSGASADSRARRRGWRRRRRCEGAPREASALEAARARREGRFCDARRHRPPTRARAIRRRRRVDTASRSGTGRGRDIGFGTPRRARAGRRWCSCTGSAGTATTGEET